MRARPISDCHSAQLLSSSAFRPFFGVSRLRMWVLAVVATVFAGLAPSAAKADTYTIGNITISSAQEAAVLLVVAANGDDDYDPVAREEMRQLLLWMLWRLGGNPWELDPNWVPPIGGNP